MSLFYLLVCVALAAYAFSRLRVSINWLVYDPICLLLLGLAFVYAFIPWVQNLVGIQRLPGIYGARAKVTAGILVIFYAATAMLGYLAVGGLNSRGLPYLRPMTRNERRWAMLFIGIPSLIGVALLSRHFLSFDPAYYLKNRIMLRRGQGPLISLAFLSLIFFGFLLADICVNQKARSQQQSATSIVVCGLLGIAISVIFTAMGNRNFVFLLLVLGCSISLVVFKVTFQKLTLVAAAALALAVFFSVWAQVRVQLGEWKEISADVSTDQHLLIRGLSGAFGNAENLTWLSQYQGRWDPLEGESFYAGLLNPIPRSVWPDKPFGGGPALKNMVMPGSYVLAGENLTSYTTGLPVEAYMNFKLFGILLFGTLNGMVLGWFKRRYLQKKVVNAVDVTVYAFSIVMFAFGFLYMEFLGAWSRYLTAIAPCLVFEVFSRRQILTRMRPPQHAAA